MDRVLVGGLDMNVNRTVVNGMDAFGAVTKFDGPPEKASRPFDKGRSGTMISDGGALIVLETLESAKERGLTKDDIYGEMSGFGLNCDAFHALRPTDRGVGLVAAIQEALVGAGLTPADIDCFNCHATSTPKGDQAESNTIKSILAAERDFDKFREMAPEEIVEITGNSTDLKPVITAIKGHVGHLVAGAGPFEAAMAFLTLKTQTVPPIRNLEDPLCSELNFARHPHKANLKVIVKNSLVFGGINCSMVLRTHH